MEATGVTAEDICTRAQLTPDQMMKGREYSPQKASIKRERYGERPAEARCGKSEFRGTGKWLERKEMSKLLSPCLIKYLPIESPGPKSSDLQLAYKQHTSNAAHSATEKTWERGLQGSDQDSENKNLAEACPPATFSHHNANLSLPSLSVPTQLLPVPMLILP